MAKRPTKKDKLAECHTAYIAAKAGTRPKRGTRDGSIPTYPTVPCPDLPERGKDGVQDLCHKWLKARRVFCDLHDCGVGPEHVIFGIKGAGDEIGILPDGRHFEIEYKRGKGGKLSKDQQQRMADVRATNGVYFVVHGLPEMEYYMGGLI